MINSDPEQFQTIRSYPITRATVQPYELSQTSDWVVEEVPVALEFNGISHATMLMTPNNLEDFAYGFAYSENIIRHADDIRSIEIEAKEHGIVLQIEIASACFNQLKLKKRSMTGRTGCGLCGIETLEQLEHPLNPVQSDALFSFALIHQAAQTLSSHQSIYSKTGASHAAALVNQSGEIIIVREDVGRHNALDKLIGAALRAKYEVKQCAIVVSSRASYEMTQKTIHLGCPLLVAISAPTSFAIRTAQQFNLSLMGFTKKNQSIIYTHPQRIVA